MKKITLLLAIFVTSILSAQTTYFEEDFNDEEAQGWTFVDVDGDDSNWQVVQIQDADGNPVNTPVLRSYSYSGVALTPNNYAITPGIDLSSANEGDEVFLNWEISAADADFADEKYGVYVATSNEIADLSSSQTTLVELVTDNGPGGSENFYQKSIDLSDFAGSEDLVYVAFRHFDVTDEFTIELDNVTVSSNQMASVEDATIANFTHFIDTQNVLHLTAQQNFNSVNVFNLLGSQVEAQVLNSNDAQVNLSNLSAGIYIGKVNVAGAQKSFKFVVK